MIIRYMNVLFVLPFVLRFPSPAIKLRSYATGPRDVCP